ncbi:Nif3-like dinuclear metal center hexameric protein [Haliea sp. E1-2-M8]|uniref:Nif3-like dinuclear metal center hexameric protein n=1 Tax=Haliea sp. E1-2-M8 TaxID=3064706 RepID=UPI0027233187|nr:Nif3-like dinuclear metal center hexameric protein [Haliea sp. E1-2-M8]MDO8861373.1 Nif3-like dinuclear metal center hexameric protein [Haliea sp. E1-2-M8]
MPVDLQQLVAYTDNLLQAERFADYCPNGLQVQGRSQVERIVSGVTACQPLLDAAAELGADLVLVHHGFFWRGEAQPVVGMKRRRLGRLLLHDISLLAYHLPLDAHPELGNNAQLGELLGILDQQPLDAGNPEGVGCIGSLPAPLPAAALVAQLATLTGRAPLHIGDSAAPVQRIAWCTGAAQSYIGAAVAAGADLFLTGEVSEQTVHIAREEGLQFIAAGHHATERYGVQALGAHLAARFGLEHRFVDIDNPA